MLAEIESGPALKYDWGKMERNLCPILDFEDVIKMTEEDFYLWANGNSLYVGDLNRGVFMEMAGEFLESDIFARCHGLSSQRFGISPSVVVTGSVVYNTFYKQRDKYGWVFEMTGSDKLGYEKQISDFDFWIPRKTMLHLSNEMGIIFKQTNTNSNVVIAEIVENGKKIQIHALKDYDLNPLIANTFLSYKNLSAISIVFDGPNRYFVDPFCALEKGPWGQEFPYRLFDEKNFLFKGQPRIAMSIMLWAITTPFMPEIKNELEVRNKVSGIINNMDHEQLISMCKKYLQYFLREAYPSSELDDIKHHQVTKFAKLGILPTFLSKTKGQTDKEIVEAREILLDEIAYFAYWERELGTELSKILPKVTEEECHFNMLEKTNYSRLEEIAKQIDWNKVANFPLTTPLT